MQGHVIYFTAKEIASVNKFFEDFEIYFSPLKDKETFEMLLHRGMWLILRKFPNNCLFGKNIYFSYEEIHFIASFINAVDSFLPGSVDMPLKDDFLKLVGPAFNKFLSCYKKYYDLSMLWWIH